MIDRSRGITYILSQEAANSMGLSGKKLEVAMEALDRFDRNGGDRTSARGSQLLQNAAYALSAYIIQREALGLRDHSSVSAQYGVSREIWNLIGISGERIDATDDGQRTTDIQS